MFDPSVTLHSGASVPEGLTFKASPPDSIGVLQSVQSVVRGKGSIRSLIDWLTLPLFFGPMILFGSVAFWYANMSTEGLIGFVTVALIVWILLRWRRPLAIETFVGDRGVAICLHYDRRGHEDTVTTSLTFQDATELRYAIRDFYSNLSYNGSNFVFRWFNGNGQLVFSTHGAFYRAAEGISEESNYYFGIAARNAWNNFLTARLAEEFKSTGECRFRIFDSDQIAVGDGYMECVFGGRATRLLPEDVVSLAVVDGGLQMETRTSKWYRHGLIGRMNCGRISNSDHLFHMLEEYGRFRFSNE